ncbi:MAG TPA: SUMF1/EgtB/PvdO family nonheme iron enzyme [Polyangiaceae bacterium]|nr:SUMF1/EgtB/PvdO family nonheme iron enzyme [Polyangiaceae bacterium]
MIGRVLLFTAIGGLSLAAAIWLVPLRQVVPASVQEAASRVKVSAATARVIGQSNNSNGPLAPSSAVSAAGAWGEIAGHPAATESSGQESALSVAACPSGMSFVGQPGFCIDRYEYPNLAAVVPATLISFEEAKKTCDAEGKRLCTDREWTQACIDLPAGATEQQEYGGGRCNYGAGNVSRSGARETTPQDDNGDLSRMGEPEAVARTLATLDKRVPSGRMADCVSSSGVADLLGNVQEWVQSGNPSYQAAQKGGHFGTESPSCAAASNVRHAAARHPGSGFRCCARPLLRGSFQPVERRVPEP